MYHMSGLDPAHNDGLRYIGAGMGFNPLNNHVGNSNDYRMGYPPVRDDFAIHSAEVEIGQVEPEDGDWCQTLPSSYHYQKETIYKE